MRIGAFGMLVVVPPQSWLEVMQKHSYTGSYADFMGLYLAGYKGFCDAAGKFLALPTWNHLWFLPYLFLYTLLLWLGLRRWPAMLEWPGTRLGSVLHGLGLLVLPTLYLALTLLSLRKSFPQNYSVWGDWFCHSQYFAMFILGAVLARKPEFWPRMTQQRWVALMLALTAWLMLVSAPWLARELQLPMRTIGPWAYCLQQWCAIVAVLGFAQRHQGGGRRPGQSRQQSTPSA